MNETEFYDRLAQFFDVMTDWKSRLAFELPFIQQVVESTGARSVLDCACGTGWHAIALAERGYIVTGSDASREMIERARANAQRQDVRVPFHVTPFLNLRLAFQTPFDAVLCLGNSFPHVLNDEVALDALQNMRACLRPGGMLLLHNLNYNKRWKDRPRWFPVNSGQLSGRETLVWRFADYGEQLITFHIALFTRGEDGGWSVQVQSTLQRPYQEKELSSLLERAGFKDLSTFGDLTGKPFDPESSSDCVILAHA